MTHFYTPPRKTQRKTEHDLQVACVRWFRYTHPDLALCLFAVPNGGYRDQTTGAMLKAEGATAGVADLLLLAPSHDRQHHALAIEMKTTLRGSVQRETQKQWQAAVEAQGNRYVLCRSLDTFMATIADYLGEPPTDYADTTLKSPIFSPTRHRGKTEKASLRTTAEELKLIAALADTQGGEK